MPFGVENFINAMEKYVPGSRPSMEKFFQLCKDIHSAQAYTNSVNGNTDSKVMLAEHDNFVRVGSYCVNEVLQTLKMPQKAQDILNAYWCYLGADGDNLSFVSLRFYGLQIYHQGCVHAENAFARNISCTGGAHTRTGMRRLDEYRSQKTKTDDSGAVCGVVLDDGTEIETRHVVANCAPHLVFGKMMDNVPQEVIRATNARKFAGRGWSMFLGLNKSCDELGIENHNYFLYDTSDTVKQYKRMEKIATNEGQATVCLNRAYPECSPKGTTMMYFTTLYMSDDWGNVQPKDYFR